MPRVGFEPTIPVFERAKKVHGHSDRITQVYIREQSQNFVRYRTTHCNLVWCESTALNIHAANEET
jgi:hypothetical protein